MFKDAIKSVDPFWKAMITAFSGEGRYKLMPEDYLKPIRTVSSVNAGTRMWDAVNTGRWMSKEGQYLDDVSPLQATFQTAFGLQSTKASDAYLGRETLKDREDKVKETARQFSEQMKRYLMATRDKNYEQAAEYFKNGMVILRQRGYPETEISRAFAQAMDDNRTLHSKIDWDLATKNIPGAEIKIQQDYYTRKQQVKGQ
jgi:hypothetical protein